MLLFLSITIYQFYKLHIIAVWVANHFEACYIVQICRNAICLLNTHHPIIHKIMPCHCKQRNNCRFCFCLTPKSFTLTIIEYCYYFRSSLESKLNRKCFFIRIWTYKSNPLSLEFWAWLLICWFLNIFVKLLPLFNLFLFVFSFLLFSFEFVFIIYKHSW